MKCPLLENSNQSKPPALSQFSAPSTALVEWSYLPPIWCSVRFALRPADSSGFNGSSLPYTPRGTRGAEFLGSRQGSLSAHCVGSALGEGTSSIGSILYLKPEMVNYSSVSEPKRTIILRLTAAAFRKMPGATLPPQLATLQDAQ